MIYCAYLMIHILQTTKGNVMVKDPLFTCVIFVMCIYTEITPCLTFGCDEVSGEKCECFYNNVCPLQRLPYYTKEECEDTIKSTLT